MIKIPSSYNKLIKNRYVLDNEEDKKVLDVDYKLIPKRKESLSLESSKKDKDDESGDKVYNLEELKEEIEMKVVRDIEDERQRVLLLAQDEAVEIKKKAQESGYEAGYSRALEEGYRDGLEKAEKEMKEAKENSLDLIVQAEGMVNDYVKENENRIIRLAADMAESIVGFSIENSSDGILNLVKPVVAEYSKKEKIIISCNPVRYDFLKSNLKELEEISPDTKFFVFKDENLGLNDCIVESEDQFIDLGIKGQLDSIINTIKHME